MNEPTQGTARTFYAHSLPAAPGKEAPPSITEWEPLEEHLRKVAKLAESFAAAWNAGVWGLVLGLWHDLGKYTIDFLNYLFSANGVEAHLKQVRGRVDHSTAGAQHARRQYDQKQALIGDILAYCIAGHHGGLPDFSDSHGSSGLSDRLKKPVPAIEPPPEDISLLRSCPRLTVPLRLVSKERAAYHLAFFTRMLFSTLVDADFLATEQFMNPERATQRGEPPAPDWAAWDSKLTTYIDQLARGKSEALMTSDLSRKLLRHRRAVLEACRSWSAEASGLFWLAVPTGGGKTLASLSFAVRHAQAYGLRRIVYAIPFTSIIEQTADVFRLALQGMDERSILEHHVNLDPEKETPWSRLATENWDAPLVVTTNVQFFESLHAAKPSACRKLHRLARSVIILDEVQTLPVTLLAPCLASIDELARNYGCSIVLCTATPPAFDRRDRFPIGLEGVREISPEPTALLAKVQRAQASRLGTLDDDRLASLLHAEDQALCIVNTRPHAARLFMKLLASSETNESTDEYFHLSTRLCGQHRSNALTKIRKRLKKGQRCLVVSTQLVEAGVDLDFPAVYRALAGLDALVQAAGRCNREGRLASGRFLVFEPTDVKLPRGLESSIETAQEILPDYEDLLSSDAVEAFFRLHYQKHQGQWDKPGVLGGAFALSSSSGVAFQFREVAREFRMIDDEGVPVVVPYGLEGRRLVERVLDCRPMTRDDYRRLQRYTVSVPYRTFQALDERGSLVLQESEGRPAVLGEPGLYDERLGLLADDAAASARDPADFIL